METTRREGSVGPSSSSWSCRAVTVTVVVIMMMMIMMPVICVGADSKENDFPDTPYCNEEHKKCEEKCAGMKMV